jgi:hypothetical protein
MCTLCCASSYIALFTCVGQLELRQMACCLYQGGRITRHIHVPEASSYYEAEMGSRRRSVTARHRKLKQASVQRGRNRTVSISNSAGQLNKCNVHRRSAKWTWRDGRMRMKRASSRYTRRNTISCNFQPYFDKPSCARQRNRKQTTTSLVFLHTTDEDKHLFIQHMIFLTLKLLHWKHHGAGRFITSNHVLCDGREPLITSLQQDANRKNRKSVGRFVSCEVRLHIESSDWA